MEYHVQYQRRDPASRRPLDYAMNEQELTFTKLELLPNVGDHIHFMFESDGEKGLFCVRSRLFTYTIHPETGEWRIFANIIAEEASNWGELIKE